MFVLNVQVAPQMHTKLKIPAHKTKLSMSIHILVRHGMNHIVPIAIFEDIHVHMEIELLIHEPSWQTIFSDERVTSARQELFVIGVHVLKLEQVPLTSLSHSSKAERTKQSPSDERGLHSRLLVHNTKLALSRT